MRAAGTAMPATEKGSHERIFSFLTATIAWVMIVMMSVPANPDYYVTGLVTNDSSSLTRTLWLLIFAIAIVILLLRMSLSLRVIRQVNIFFLLFVALATISITWSIDPGQTGIRIFRLLVMSAVFLAIAVGGWDSRRFQELIRPPVTVLLVGSIIFCLVRPDLAIHHDPEPELFNAWRGLFPTKNSLGGAAAFGFIFWAHAWLSRETGRVRATLGVLFQQATINLSEPLWLNVLLTEFAVMSIATTCIARALLEVRVRAKPMANHASEFSTAQDLRHSHLGPRRSGKSKLNFRFPHDP
jgi:hypothetical protein